MKMEGLVEQNKKKLETKLISSNLHIAFVC